MVSAVALTIEEVEKRLGIPKDVLIREGLRLFLQNEARNLKAEILRIGAKYGVKSFDELWKKIENGEISETDCLDDLIKLEHLENKLREVLSLLGEKQ